MTARAEALDHRGEGVDVALAEVADAPPRRQASRATRGMVEVVVEHQRAQPQPPGDAGDRHEGGEGRELGAQVVEGMEDVEAEISR
ncbi:MAG TPA: hypothetical protein VHT75_10010 [Acidimicrobiales bacterium]|nr:hypothetical protein [Acidimicrobiales bacterium]